MRPFISVQRIRRRQGSFNVYITAGGFDGDMQAKRKALETAVQKGTNC
jgi:hypothetical protein